MDLVVGASNSAVKSLVNKLGSLLAQEYALISGVRDDIQYINDELASMQAFLNRIKRADDQDEQRQDWMKQVREVSYDIEDCVDNVSHRLDGEPRGTSAWTHISKKWYVLKTLYARHRIATEISNLKIRAQHVSERRSRYGVVNLKNVKGRTEANATRDHLAPPPQLIGIRAPVGIEDAMGELEPWFTKAKTLPTDHNLRFLAIVGFGGLGKTTLAMALYQKFGLGDEFSCRASVLASQKFHLQTVLRKLLEQFHEQRADASKNDLQGIEDWKDEQLIRKLRVQLSGRRYTIVVDDIWSVSAWEKIRDSLPNGGSIVVTTRFNSVAEACRRRQGEVHKLKPLTDESSYRLFHEIIVNADYSDQRPLLTAQGRDLMLKCTGRLPLAIILVSGLMATKVKSEQKFTINNHLRKLQVALSEVLLDNITLEGVTQILDHCYKELPADLKTCLLYLSMFPKGCQISRKRLIRRWIAEGFLFEKHGKTVKEVAEDCFSELIGRNLIRAVNNSSNGKVKNCQIHDMVLEYIVSKSSDENFITVVGGHWQTPFPSYKVRRLSVQKNDGKEKETVERMKLSHVRSLTAMESLKTLHSTLHKFRIMQVLDLEGCKDLSPKQLKKICKMRQLKYLSLRRTDVKDLPPNIGRLEYLVVLDIRETEVRKLPQSVDKLRRVEHLLAGNKNKRHALILTEGITKMTALQTLSGVEICTGLGKEPLRGLQNLTNLKKFTIYKVGKLTNEELLLSAIEHLSSCSLKYLGIDDDFTGFLDRLLNASQAPPEHLHTLGLCGMLSQLPKWINHHLYNLEKLTLSLTSLTRDAMLNLAMLPELFSLTFFLDTTKANQGVLEMLSNNTLKSGGKIFVLADGFRKLKLLRFMTPVLPLLSFMDGAMPELERLELKIKFIEGIYGLENLENLQQVLLTVSSKAPDDAREKASQIKRLTRLMTNAPIVVYNESSEEGRSIAYSSTLPSHQYIPVVCESSTSTPIAYQRRGAHRGKAIQRPEVVEMAFFEAGIECSVAELLWMLLELLSGVSGGDWHHLQSQLRTIHDRIDVCYESLDNSDDQAWAWVTQARELAYDMDDCICFRRYYNNGSANPSLSGFLEWIRGLKDISHKLRDLEARFNALKQEVRSHSIFDGQAGAVPEPIDDPEPVHLVGHHAAMGELVRMVMDSGDKAERKIISIAGMAGSGKTTLAATVYLQVREQNRFQCRVFVSVGQKPDLRGTLKKMLSQLGGRARWERGD
ncbi:hypothetical protein QOZ80_9AG0688590 [Eleusine coracana subsp. coracana]|nr:hypothetical protein QOZ80_9AG0688590 [Eleusine coracana subsp. coracana]